MIDSCSMTEPRLPLQGIRVLELAQVVAGPFCGTLMAEFGAEVIKTEMPGRGDDLRRLGPSEGDCSYWFAVDNRNKKLMTLDLHAAKGQDIVRRLVAHCDVVLENFRPGVLERWGLGWEALHAINPRLVMARITAFGQTGPLNQGPGYAAIASAFGGTWYVNGHADRPPARPTPVYPDYMTGLFTAFGVLAALRHRDATGEGQWIDAALYESAFRVMEYTTTLYGRQHVVRERGELQHAGWPGGAFRTLDEKWIVFTGAGAAPVRAALRDDRPARPSSRSAVRQRDGAAEAHRRDRRPHAAVVRGATGREGTGRAHGSRHPALADHEHGRHLRRSALSRAGNDHRRPRRGYGHAAAANRRAATLTHARAGDARRSEARSSHRRDPVRAARFDGRRDRDVARRGGCLVCAGSSRPEWVRARTS